ncbi:hypothetical protein DX933_03000 [Ornithinibacillus gellani]|uniref:hypothetical protein n=1 Tax=Ornithinibacillus gellani TaxID=2293253 RepID=UPI000F4A9E94|nr:hypothetical protein [Ornithinibacillus gellani]TQS76042.1 hypothetical protein DX933_03000 [Ornithinibacillus gellani]
MLYILRVLCFIFVSLLAACTSMEEDEREQEALQMAEEFIELHYTVSDYQEMDKMEYSLELLEKMEPYVTEAELTKLKKEREEMYPLDLAKRLKYNIHVEQVDFQTTTETNHGQTLELSFELGLNFSDHPSKPDQSLDMKGEMTFEDWNGEWKISRYWVQEIDPNDLE